MGTQLDFATVATGRWPTRRGGLRLGVQATRAALARSDRHPTEVDLLINAGLYHDRNLGEPALAPLIQEDAGINPSDPRAGSSGAFSFDIANGACGVLTALEIADGFLQAGTSRTAVVVAEDAPPGRHLAKAFPFKGAGGAIVCSWRRDGAGLGPVVWHRARDWGHTFEAQVSFDGGVNVLNIRQDPEYSRLAANAAVAAADGALERVGDRDGVDLVVTGFSDPVIIRALIDKAGFHPGQLVTAGAGLHTVGLIDGIARAIATGRMGPGSRSLLVAVGAGILAGAALYSA